MHGNFSNYSKLNSLLCIEALARLHVHAHACACARSHACRRDVTRESRSIDPRSSYSVLPDRLQPIVYVLCIERAYIYMHEPFMHFLESPRCRCSTRPREEVRIWLPCYLYKNLQEGRAPLNHDHLVRPERAACIIL